MRSLDAHIAVTRARVESSLTDLACSEAEIENLIARRAEADEELEYRHLQFKQETGLSHEKVAAVIGAVEQVLHALDDQIRAETARRTTIADVIEAGMASVEASEVALTHLSIHLNRTPRRALKAIDLAAWIAGACYPWAAEAWLADISVAPDNSGRPVNPMRQFLSALAIVLWTAPRMRTRALWWTLTSAAERLGRWCLYYDPATATIVGASHVALVEVLHDEAGFYPSVVLATAVALAAVEIIRRIRRTTGEKADRY